VGHFIKHLDLKERILAALSSTALMIFIYNRHLIWFAGGLMALAIFIAWQVWVMKKDAQKTNTIRAKV
jgi:hypothetical protein